MPLISLSLVELRGTIWHYKFYSRLIYPFLPSVLKYNFYSQFSFYAKYNTSFEKVPDISTLKTSNFVVLCKIFFFKCYHKDARKLYNFSLEKADTVFIKKAVLYEIYTFK